MADDGDKLRRHTLKAAYGSTKKAPILKANARSDLIVVTTRRFGGLTMKLAQAAIVVATLWPVSASSGGFYDGNQLYNRCNAAPEKLDSIFCIGYVTGVMDSLQSIKAICLPDNVVVRQGVDVVTNHLRTHPERRQNSAVSESFVALQKAFPCEP
jgi:hypothetical protein